MGSVTRRRPAIRPPRRAGAARAGLESAPRSRCVFNAPTSEPMAAMAATAERSAAPADGGGLRW